MCAPEEHLPCGTQTDTASLCSTLEPTPAIIIVSSFSRQMTGLSLPPGLLQSSHGPAPAVFDSPSCCSRHTGLVKLDLGLNLQLLLGRLVPSLEQQQQYASLRSSHRHDLRFCLQARERQRPMQYFISTCESLPSLLLQHPFYFSLLFSPPL